MEEKRKTARVMILSDSKLLTTEYAKGVTSHIITTSKKVFQACQRHLKDLERQGTKKFPYVFDEEKGHRPVEYIQRFCKPSQGDYDRLELQPWQHFIVGSLYGWVHKDSGVRRFKEGLIFVGRKNGKSTLVSGLSLYSSSKDGENGARVYQLANSKEQAKEVFDECVAMVKSSPILNRHFDPTNKEIRFGRTMSKIIPLATDSKKMDGKNCSFGVFDEIHEYKNYKLINVIKNSTGARKQPLLLYITTAGYQLDGPLVDYYDKAADVLDGVIDDERCFYFLAELDEKDDLDNPENWIKANPNLGTTLKLETLIEEWESRKHIPAERSDFITKRLNLFVKSDEQSFLDYSVIKRNDKVINIETLKNRNCIGSFDLSESEDFTSACLEFPLDTGEVFVLSHSWIPRKKVLADNEKIPYLEFAKDGLLTIVDEDYIKLEQVYDWFVAKSKIYTIEKIAYDPAKAYRLVKDLESYGFVTEIVRQGPLTLTPGLRDLETMFMDGKVIFNKNRLLRWYINNVKLKKNENGSWLPQKQNRYRKIDGFAAMLNSHIKTMEILTTPQGNGDIEFVSVSDLFG
ncbi:terminase large subunit [Peribacillus simplex]|nr:terminase large subunit [Peribacillus simplex]